VCQNFTVLHYITRNTLDCNQSDVYAAHINRQYYYYYYYYDYHQYSTTTATTKNKSLKHMFYTSRVIAN